ncbi:MAG: Dihydroneopterin aldolase, partial [uncultured Rubrobacteraceae bacterium]
ERREPRPHPPGRHGLLRLPRYPARRTRARAALRRGRRAAPGPAARRPLRRPDKDRGLRRGPPPGEAGSGGGSRRPHGDRRGAHSERDPGGAPARRGRAGKGQEAQRPARRHRPLGLGRADPAPQAL